MQAQQRIPLGMFNVLDYPSTPFLLLLLALLFLVLEPTYFLYSAKPGKIVGPVALYENGTIMKDAYDPRTFIRSTGLPPQSVHPAYTYSKSNTGNQERSERELPSQAKQGPQCSMAAKFAPDIAINIDSNPFFMTRVKKVEPAVTNDTNLLQARGHYSGIGVGASGAATGPAQRKAGTVQYGMTRMY